MSAPKGQTVIINNPDAVPSNLDENATDSVKNDGVMVDRTLQAVATAPNQLSDQVAAYITLAANLLGVENATRVQPGQLKLKEPKTAMEIFDKWYYIFDYAGDIGWNSPIVTQFFVLVWCTVYGLATEKQNGYCYDNIYADLTLNGGKPTDGIYKYVDVFTWGGFLEVYLLGIINFSIYTFFFQTLVGLFLTAMYSKLADAGLPLCAPGEQELIIGGRWNLCLYADTIG